LAREGDKFLFVPEYVTEYRLHPNSTTGRGFVNYKELFEDLEPRSVRAEIEPYKRKLLPMVAFRAACKVFLTGDVDYCPEIWGHTPTASFMRSDFGIDTSPPVSE
jgi:hypothetical protein